MCLISRHVLRVYSLRGTALTTLVFSENYICSRHDTTSVKSKRKCFKFSTLYLEYSLVEVVIICVKYNCEIKLNVHYHMTSRLGVK